MGYTKIIAMGRVGRDAELRYTAKETPVLSFSIAVNVGWGERKRTDWYSCSYFGKRAVSIEQYITKGTMLLVEGEPSLHQYTTKTGEQKASIQIMVSEIKFAGGSDRQTQQTSEPQQATMQDYDEDEVPF